MRKIVVAIAAMTWVLARVSNATAFTVNFSYDSEAGPDVGPPSYSLVVDLTWNGGGDVFTWPRPSGYWAFEVVHSEQPVGTFVLDVFDITGTHLVAPHGVEVAPNPHYFAAAIGMARDIISVGNSGHIMTSVPHGDHYDSWNYTVTCTELNVYQLLIQAYHPGPVTGLPPVTFTWPTPDAGSTAGLLALTLTAVLGLGRRSKRPV